MKLKRYSIKIVTIITALTLCIGCEAAFSDVVATPPGGCPDDPGSEDNIGSDIPKRPIPIKPKKNPDGKIERPKLIDELINKVTLPK